MKKVLVVVIITAMHQTWGGTFAKYEGFLPAYQQNEAVIWRDCNINDIKAMTATMSGAWLNGKDFQAFAYIYDRTPTSFSVQFQCVDGGTCKSTLYHFRQDGADVKCWGQNSGFQSHAYGTKLTADFYLQVSTSKSNGAYGAYGVEVVEDKVEDLTALGESVSVDRTALNLVAPAGGATVNATISGNGPVRITAAESQQKIFDAYLNYDFQTFAENVSLDAIEVTGGVLNGSWMPGAPYDGTPMFVKNETIDGFRCKTLQMQAQCSDWYKCVHIILRQNGSNVEAKADWSGYVSLNEPWGNDFEKKRDELVAVADSASGIGYGVASINYTLKPTLTLAGTKSWAWGEDNTVIDGASVIVTTSALPASRRTVIRNGGSLRLEAAGGAWYGGDSRTYVVEKGSKLVLNGWLATAAGATVVVDGGTLEERNNSNDYLNALTLKNGGCVTGGGLRMGYASDVTCCTEGAEPVFIEGAVEIFNNGSKSITFDTAATTEIRGGVIENGSYLGATFVKAGAATLTIPSWILQTPLVVREGTLVVTKTGVTNGGLKLAGGTFKSGAEAIAVGALELSGNATIDAGTGSISFADSSAVEWSEGAKLTIPSSVNLRQDVIKFGSSANGLTAAQLKAIVWAGGSSGHVTLDANGYLRPLERFIITIR